MARDHVRPHLALTSFRSAQVRPHLAQAYQNLALLRQGHGRQAHLERRKLDALDAARSADVLFELQAQLVHCNRLHPTRLRQTLVELLFAVGNRQVHTGAT